MNYRRAFVTAKVLEGMSVSWFGATYLFFFTAMGYPVWTALVANMCFMLVYTFLDPYTGNLGDRYGHRLVYVLGNIFWATGLLIYFSTNTLPVFFVAETFAAIGRALTSQALESWLDNSLEDDEAKSIRIQGRRWQRLAGIPTGICGGLIGAAIGFQYPLLLAAASSYLHAAVTAILTYRFPREGHRLSLETETPSLRESIRELALNRYLRFATLVVLVTSFAYQPLNMYWTEIMRQASDADWWQGFMWVGITIAFSEGIRRAKGWHSTLHTLVLVIGSIGLCILVSVWGSIIGSLGLLIFAFILHELPRGALEEVVYDYCRKHIRDQNRSTMNSLRSAAAPLGSFFGLLVFTLVSAGIPNLEVTWIISGGILIAFAYWIWLRK